MAQTKDSVRDRIGNFFSWARRGKQPVSVDVARREDQPDSGSREVTIQQLKSGYGEVIETMKSVRSHLEVQADRSDRMLQLLEGLPDALRTIPESNRAQARLLEAIHNNLERQNETSGQLTSAITGLREAAQRQDGTLGKISEHLEADHATREQLNSGIDSMNDTMRLVESASNRSREAVTAVAEQARVSDEHMREVFRRSQRTSVMMFVATLAVAFVALFIGLYGIMMIGQMTSAQAPAEGVPINPPAQTESPAPEGDATSMTPEPIVPDAGVSLAADEPTPTAADQASQRTIMPR